VNATQLPIICTLTDEQLRERRAGSLDRLAATVVERRELENGIALRFEPSAETLTLIAEVIDAERQCCAFLGFTLTVDSANGPVWLELTGPPGTRDVVREILNF
jgi:hypothetical protein